MFDEKIEQVLAVERKLFVGPEVNLGFDIGASAKLPSGEEFRYISAQSSIHIADQNASRAGPRFRLNRNRQKRIRDFQDISFLFFADTDPASRCHLQIRYIHEMDGPNPLPIERIEYRRWFLREGRWKGANCATLFLRQGMPNPEKSRNALYHLAELYDQLASAKQIPLPDDSPYFDLVSYPRSGGWNGDENGSGQGPFR